MKHLNVLLGQFLLIILSAIIGIVPLFSEGKVYSAALIFLHILIVLWCCGSLFSSPHKPYSLFIIVHVFSLFFFGIAPILQYNNMVTFWGAARLPETAYIQTSSTILAILVLYNIVYAEIYHRVKIPSIFLRMVKKLELKNCLLRNRLSLQGKHVMLLLGTAVFLLVFYSYDFSVVKLFFRGVLDDLAQGNSGDTGFSSESGQSAPRLPRSDLPLSHRKTAGRRAWRVRGYRHASALPPGEARGNRALTRATQTEGRSVWQSAPREAGFRWKPA